MAYRVQTSIFTTGTASWQRCLKANPGRRFLAFQNLAVANNMFFLPISPGPIKDNLGTLRDMGLNVTFNQVLMLDYHTWARIITEDWYVFDQFGPDQLSIIEGLIDG